MSNVRKAGSQTVTADSEVARAIEKTHGFSGMQKRREARQKKKTEGKAPAKAKGDKS